MLHSVEPAVRGSYRAGLLRFNQFCNAVGVDEIDRMPASDSLLSVFAASAAAKVSLGTAKKWLLGIHMSHQIQGAVWLQGELTKRALAGVAKLVPPTSIKDARLPITYEHILALHDPLDLSNSRDAAVWAIASVAFWGCCRLGELVIPSVKSFNAERHVKRGPQSQIKFKHAVGDQLSYATFRIPWSKTKKREGDTIRLTDIPDVTSPVEALCNHLRVNVDVPDGAPLFAFKADGGWQAIMKDWFIAICNEIWSDAKLDAIKTGHSFRIGGATEWLLRGLDPNMVAQQGRWESSNCFWVYWRKMEQVLPIYINRTFYASASAEAQDAMRTFAVRHHLL
ncbi:DNA breaking-rejoining enzyme [Amylostereum chailletii]|nr:DNA breaking-rejoining enzyme [Amylostereum chailletii]